MLKALERYYAAGGESVETLIADMEQDAESGGGRQGAGEERHDRPDQRRGPGRQRPGAQAAEHGAVAGDQGPRQRLALRALRERVQDPHPRRRRAVRDGAAAAAPGLRHHHPHQGHGQPGHRRAAAAAGRPHPADAWAATRSTSASACCPPCSARAWCMRVLDRSVVMLDLDAVGMAAGHPARLPRDDPQAQRHRAGDRADRLRQDHHALRRAERVERHRGQAHHHRGPGRVRDRRHRADSHRRRRSATPSPTACGRSCGRTRTRSWWARSATWRRPRSPCRPR